MNNIKIIKADYRNKKQAGDIAFLLNEYAKDPMGGASPLPDTILNNVVPELSKLVHAFSVLTYVEEKPAGLINCFEAFSTFSCKPLINIHDVIVLKDFRGMKLSQKMLAMVEAIAIEKSCCKLTLEVLSNNQAAQAAYQRFGFKSYELDPEMGIALFWQKELI